MMSVYDNEIYRGPQESVPTLKQHEPSYGTDIYIVKPPEATLPQDMPATEETFYEETVSVKKKKNRVSKALKLIASCAAAVTVATAAVPTAPEPELPLWPSYTIGWGYDAAALNSWDCQASIGHKSYRITARQEGLYVMWLQSFFISNDGLSGAFSIYMKKPAENLEVLLDFGIDPENMSDNVLAFGKIRTTSGEVLPVRCVYHTADVEAPTAQQLIDDLANYIEISDKTDDNGWDKLMIGDSLYSETNASWNGTETVLPSYDEEDFFMFDYFTENEYAPYSEKDLICKRRINGINWSFYYTATDIGYGLTEPRLWAKPPQEDFSIGIALFYSPLFDRKKVPPLDGSEIGEELRNTVLETIDHIIIPKGLCYYYPIEQMPKEKPTVWTPPDSIPASVPPTPTPEPVPTTVVETEELLEGGTRTTTSYYNAEGKLEKEESVRQIGETEYFRVDTMNEFERPILRESTTYENGLVTDRTVYDLEANLTTEEAFEYYDSGAPKSYSRRLRDCYWDFNHKVFESNETFEFFVETYDESGAIIVYVQRDDETGLYRVHNYRTLLGSTYGAPEGEMRDVEVYADGLFTTSFPTLPSELVEGIYTETFVDIGTTWEYAQIDPDGSKTLLSYHPDGSLLQSVIMTFDEGTNTWTEVVEHHPNPSDSFAYHTEIRVTFDGSGKITAYYENSDGFIIDILFSEAPDAEINYADGKTSGFHHIGEDYEMTVWFEYDPLGRLSSIAGNTFQK